VSDEAHTHHYEYEILQTGPDRKDVEIIARCTQCEKALDADEIMALVNEAQVKNPCSICGQAPAVCIDEDHKGTYHLCGDCAFEKLALLLPQPPERE
jgi:hypothetical protein